MTFKTLDLTLTSPVILDHIKHYKNIRELLLWFFMLTIKKLKTTNVMRNFYLYVPNKGTYMTNQLY